MEALKSELAHTKGALLKAETELADKLALLEHSDIMMGQKQVRIYVVHGHCQRHFVMLRDTLASLQDELTTLRTLTQASNVLESWGSTRPKSNVCWPVY